MEGRHVKMVAYLKRNLFDTYRIQAGSDPIQPFGVSIGTMLDCLGILMPTPGETVDACKIRYMEEGQPVEFTYVYFLTLATAFGIIITRVLSF